MRACCDWLSDSGVLYFEVDEDARGKLLRVLNRVVEPLPFVVKPYAGGVPRNLSLSKHNFNTWEAMREFSLQCVQSAIPTYTRSPDVVQRIYQLVRAFDEIPEMVFVANFPSSTGTSCFRCRRIRLTLQYLTQPCNLLLI